MQLTFKPYQLEFKYPFGVSSNTRTHTPAVFTKLEHDGFVGYGEACLPKYLGETQEETILFLEKAKIILQNISNPTINILYEIDKISNGNNAAKASIDIALHDLIAKSQNKTCAELLGFKKPSPQITSCTIGIADENETVKKIKEVKHFSILKIKAGTADDKKLITQIRKYTNQPIYIDVNQGWKDKFFVLDMLHWMKEQKVILVEQPMPITMLEEMAWVTGQSPLPLIADENIKRLSDIDKIAGCFSGINIKLMKCTGMQEAFKMITYAKQKGLKILLGCMAESSCAASAMAQFMDYGDYIDLDAPNLLKYDPFSGITYENSKVIVNNGYGTGAAPKSDFYI